MKKKKYSKLIILIAYIAIITMVIMAGTYAKFTSSADGTGIAEVAAWKINFKDIEDNEFTETTTFRLRDTTITAGSIEDDRIAPGTSGALGIKLDTTGTEVAVIYQFEISCNLEELPKNFLFYQDADYNSQAELQVEGEKIIAKVSGYKYLDEIDTVTTHYIYWKWNYETLEGDEKDTNDGINANDIEFTLKMTVTQMADGCMHVWNEGEQIAAATCTGEGTILYTCTLCGDTKTSKILPTGHQSSDEYSYSKEGHYYDCKFCGLRITYVEAHTSSSNCTVCGYTGKFSVTYNLFKMTSTNTNTDVTYGSSYTTNLSPINSLAYQRPDNVIITMGGNTLTTGYTYNNVSGDLTINNITGNIVITANAKNYNENTSFTNSDEVQEGEEINANITQKWQIRVFAFTPDTTATYKFYSADSVADTRATDPYAYLYDGDQYTIEELDTMALNYSQTGTTSYLQNKCLIYNDDGGNGYNFMFTYSCTAGKTYYLAIRTYTPDKIQSFDSIYIVKN